MNYLCCYALWSFHYFTLQTGLQLYISGKKYLVQRTRVHLPGIDHRVVDLELIIATNINRFLPFRPTFNTTPILLFVCVFSSQNSMCRIVNYILVPNLRNMCTFQVCMIFIKHMPINIELFQLFLLFFFFWKNICFMHKHGFIRINKLVQFFACKSADLYN